MGCGEADAGGRRRWRRVRGGFDGHEERRKGAERCRYAEKGRDTAEGGGGCGDGGRGREPQAEGTGPAAGERGDGVAEYGGAGWCGRSDRAAGRGTYRGYGEQNEKLTGCSSGMGYCTGAEHKVVTNENSQRLRGAALCPSSEARCQGSALQGRRTGTRMQYYDTLVPGSWLMVLRTGSRRDCWDGQVAALVYSGVCGLSTDLLHGGKARCMARWCCIQTIGHTRALL